MTKLASFLSYSLNNPSFGLAYLRGVAELKAKQSKGGAFSSHYPDLQLTGAEFQHHAIANLLADHEIDSHIRELDSAKDRIRASKPLHAGGDSDLGRLCYAACLALEPEIVVEVGVARGMTTSCVLSALRRNKKGTLYSIDLPSYMASVEDTGSLVSEDLKSRWRLHLGTSRQWLPQYRAVLQSVDLAIIDGLHSYQTMRYEMQEALRMVKDGGAIVCDDIECNLAFDELRKSPRVTESWTFRKTAGVGRFGLVIL